MADKSPRKQNQGKKLTTKEKQARKKAKQLQGRGQSIIPTRDA